MKLILRDQAKDYLINIEKGMTPDPETCGWYYDGSWIAFKGDLEIDEFHSEKEAREFIRR